VKYSDAIGRAFKALKHGGLWGFAASAMLSILGVFAVLGGGAYLAVGRGSLGRFFESLSSTSGGVPDFRALIVLMGALFLASLISIPLGLIYHGGTIHLSDEAIAGRPVRVGDGWSFGARRMGRVFAVEFVVGLIATAGVFAAMVPLFAAIIGGFALGSPDKSPVPFIAGLCGGYLIFFLIVIAVSLFISAYEALSIRYGLVGERTAGDALGSAWKATRARWKNVVLFALIVLGFQYAYGMVTSLVIVPLEFLLMPGLFFPGAGSQNPEQILPQMVRFYAVVYPLIFALQLPWVVFLANLWTAFFRQLTGLDVPVPAPFDPPPPAPVVAPFAPAESQLAADSAEPESPTPAPQTD
jgi:hypothetical protein